MYFDQLLDFPILLLLFLWTILLLCHILLFGCWILSIPSGCQTVWIQIMSDILWGLIWVLTVCKGYQQTIKVDPSGQRVNYKTTCWYGTRFWLKLWPSLRPSINGLVTDVNTKLCCCGFILAQFQSTTANKLGFEHTQDHNRLLPVCEAEILQVTVKGIEVFSSFYGDFWGFSAKSAENS